MSQQYGEFGKTILMLDKAQEQVNAVWCDETAKSFGSLNHNVKLCAEKIWALYSDSDACIAAVKQNYHSDAVDKDLYRLGMQVERV